MLWGSTKTHNQEALLALLMNQSQYQKYIQVAGSILSKEGTTMAQETHRDTLAVNGGLWRGKLWGVGSSTAIERFCLVVRGPIWAWERVGAASPWSIPSVMLTTCKQCLSKNSLTTISRWHPGKQKDICNAAIPLRWYTKYCKTLLANWELPYFQDSYRSVKLNSWYLMHSISDILVLGTAQKKNWERLKGILLVGIHQERPNHSSSSSFSSSSSCIFLLLLLLFLLLLSKLCMQTCNWSGCNLEDSFIQNTKAAHLGYSVKPTGSSEKLLYPAPLKLTVEPLRRAGAQSPGLWGNYQLTSQWWSRRGWRWWEEGIAS